MEMNDQLYASAALSLEKEPGTPIKKEAEWPQNRYGRGGD
jgi:hypothetical protein